MAANDVFRDYITDGVPLSGAHKPVKQDIRTLLTGYEDELDTIDARTTVLEASDVAQGNRLTTAESDIDTLQSVAAAGVRWISNSIVVRSTANVNLASGLVNGVTLNGVVLATGQFVFLGSQTATTENGIYTVVAAGAASRSTSTARTAKTAWRDSWRSRGRTPCEKRSSQARPMTATTPFTGWTQARPIPTRD